MRVRQNGAPAARPDWLKWGLLFLAMAALGATPAPGAPDGKILGLLGGGLLFSLVLYEVYLILWPLYEEGDQYLTIAIFAVVVLWSLKTLALFAFPGFGVDVGSYQGWAGQIAQMGPAQTYQQGYFLDYPPGYLYALWIAGIMVQMLGAGGDLARVIVESPALVADAVPGGRRLRLCAAHRISTSWDSSRWLMVALNPALLLRQRHLGTERFGAHAGDVARGIGDALAGEYEIAWALAALSVLIKPQGLMILPVLGWWLLLEGDYGAWRAPHSSGSASSSSASRRFRSAITWNWIIDLYSSTAAYYHETSVNAFNFLALIGGVRASRIPDTILGVSFFALGMALLVPLYAFVAISCGARELRRRSFMLRSSRCSDFSCSRRVCMSAISIRRWCSWFRSRWKAPK